MPRTATPIAIWRNRATGATFSGETPPPIDDIRAGQYDAFCEPDAHCSILNDHSDAPCYLMGAQTDAKTLRWYDRQALRLWMRRGDLTDPDTRARLGNDAFNPARMRPVYPLHTTPEEYDSIDAFQGMALALRAFGCVTLSHDASARYARLIALRARPQAVTEMLRGGSGPALLCLCEEWVDEPSNMRLAHALVQGVLWRIHPSLRADLQGCELHVSNRSEAWRIERVPVGDVDWLALVVEG